MLATQRPPLRIVYGRNTDPKHFEWISQLVQHGLVRPSFVPPQRDSSVGDLTRLCKAQINERARSILRLENVLQDAGVKLFRYASRPAHLLEVHLRGLEALLSGVSDAEQPAELARARNASKHPAAARAAPSCFRIEHHGVRVDSCSRTPGPDAAIQNLSHESNSCLPALRDGRAAVHHPRRRDSPGAGPDRDCGPDVTRSRRSGTSPPGPAHASASTNQPASDAPDELTTHRGR